MFVVLRRQYGWAGSCAVEIAAWTKNHVNYKSERAVVDGGGTHSLPVAAKHPSAPGQDNTV